MVGVNPIICEETECTIFEEATDFSKAVGRELLKVIEMTVLGIINADCNDLIIFLTLFVPKRNPGIRQT